MSNDAYQGFSHQGQRIEDLRALREAESAEHKAAQEAAAKELDEVRAALKKSESENASLRQSNAAMQVAIRVLVKVLPS